MQTRMRIAALAAAVSVALLTADLAGQGRGGRGQSGRGDICRRRSPDRGRSSTRRRRCRPARGSRTTATTRYRDLQVGNGQANEIIAQAGALVRGGAPLGGAQVRTMVMSGRTYASRVERRVTELEKAGWSLPIYRDWILADAAKSASNRRNCRRTSRPAGPSSSRAGSRQSPADRRG